MNKNIILATDSYKLTHWDMLPAHTTRVFSYFESRRGAAYSETVFFGLQAMLDEFPLEFTLDDVEEAQEIANAHGLGEVFGAERWRRLYQKHSGILPVRICAPLEGTVVPVDNVMMTVVNTDPEFPWLTNVLESYLSHLWYPCTVATQSREVKKLIESHISRTTFKPDFAGLDFMLHDFGYRGATGHKAAAFGGAAHLINFKGTDTLPALQLIRDSYGLSEDVGFSVPATEHSIMTALGANGEYLVLDNLLKKFPKGILSVVADSYDIYSFVNEICTKYKEQILARDGVFVVRPDSLTEMHTTPGLLVCWILRTLEAAFSSTENEFKFRTLNPKVKVLWGDGLNVKDIDNILWEMHYQGYHPSNIVFGMGGGLLQKINRDTQRFAFKASAIEIDGVWRDVQKKPLDTTKLSKPGILDLHKVADGSLKTVRIPSLWPTHEDSVLRAYHYNNGRVDLRSENSFDKIRERAKI